LPSSARAQATAADLAALDERIRAEIISGVVVEKAAPSFEHGDAQSSLVAALKDPFQRQRGGPGGWWLATEVEVELQAHEVYRPDLVGWRRERVPERPRGRPIRVRPDWVCEVLSPSNAEYDLGVKLLTYHRAGIPHYWIVDPEHATLTVYRATEHGYVVVSTAGRGDRAFAEPFEAIEIAVEELFGGPPS
jgi:Uma2 family endonuclease